MSIRMFSPMLVYQTFEDTSLSDVKSKDKIAKIVKKSSMYKKLEGLLSDHYTHQPLQHVLNEPIIQLGEIYSPVCHHHSWQPHIRFCTSISYTGSKSNGVIITVERHMKWLGWAMMTSMIFNQFRVKFWLSFNNIAFVINIPQSLHVNRPPPFCVFDQATKFMVNVIGTTAVSFCLGIKVITWLLMNWK